MSFKERFIELLNNQLPGESAHIPLLPAGRKVSSEVREHAIKPIVSAVALHICIEETNDISIIFIERAEYEGTHRGQIAFPGGKIDEKDTDLIHTALRESQEEIGLSANEENLIGALSPVYIPISNFDVHPFLFLHFNSVALLADNREVSEILSVPLSEIIEDKNIHKRLMTLKDTNETIDVTGFLLQENWVWGASALILNEVKEVLKIYFSEENKSY